jgi:antitoxin ParD1/3/4
MPATAKRTFSLPSEQAAYIDALVREGSYASGSEVVRAGLRALKDRDAAVEKWLRTEVAQTFDEMRRDPARAVPAGQVFDELKTRHASRLKDKA